VLKKEQVDRRKFACPYSSRSFRLNSNSQAGPPNHHDGKVVSDPQEVLKQEQADRRKFLEEYAEKRTNWKSAPQPTLETTHGANLKSISHRCHPVLVEFVWELTK